MPESNAALTFADVAAGYGRQLAFRNVSGTLSEGECLGIIGPNGAGKTTLMRAVMGLVELQEGSIAVGGVDAGDTKGAIAYVQQSADLDLDFPVTARDVVMMGRYRNMGWMRRPGAKDRAAVDSALQRVDMAEWGQQTFGALSGGQRQRVLLARAIAQQSRLLLMDEPFNGVDSVTTQVCLEVLASMRASGVAWVVSTHDLELARKLCSQVLLMNKRQIAFGPVDRTLTPANLTEAFGSKSLAVDAEGSVITTG